MVSLSSPVAALPAAPVVSGAGRNEPAVRPQAEYKPVEQKPHAQTAAYVSAARAPADLVIQPAEGSQRLIYIFRDPDSGETIRQYPTQALVELGRRIGALLDRQV